MNYLARAEALREQMLASLRTLVETESPTADLAACTRVSLVTQELIGQWLATPATIVEHEGRPVVMWGNPHPRIALLGHLDTVWPLGTLQSIPFAITGDRITGPGVFDMKAGVIQTIAALALLTENNEIPDVGLLLTTDEETGSATSRTPIREFVSNAEACLVMEPSIEGALKTIRKGTSWYRVHVEGKAAHAGLDPHQGINALVHAASFIQEAATWGEGDTTVTPTLMTAGTTANTVPALATVTLDVRAMSRAEQERVDALVNNWSSPPASVRIEGGIDRPALEHSMTQDLFAQAEHTARDLGFTIAERAVGGASDGNLTAAAGVPTLDGLGAVGDGAHADHEWASADGIVQRTALLAALIERLRNS